MPITQSQYSRTAIMDVRSAMAVALQRHLENLVFSKPGNPAYRFSEVHDTWPSYLQRYVPPSACILPGEWTYGDALFTPHLLEDTWEVAGEPGFGLYKLSELETDFQISFRTDEVAERAGILRGIEESFRAPRLLMDDAQGPRFGLLLDMPEYYALKGRFALKSARLIDDEERAVREQRDAVVVINAQAPQVTVGPVYPLNLKIQITSC